MGRLSRHKKIKSIDPFCKRKPVVKEPKRAFDMPPSAAELDRVPTKLKNVVFGVPKPRDDKPKPDRMFSHVSALPGESMKSFARRVNSELKKRIHEIKASAPASDATGISDRRREYLEKKAENKRRKALGLPMEAEEPDWDTRGEGGSSSSSSVGGSKRPRAAMAGAGTGHDDEDDDEKEGGAGATGKKGAVASKAGKGSGGGGAGGASGGPPAAKRPRATEFPTDHVAFGERAEAPPVLRVLPRKSKRQRDAELFASIQRKTSASAGAASGSGGGDDDDDGGAAADAATAAAAAERRRADIHRQQMEKVRADTVAAYDALKRRKHAEARGKAAAGAASS